MIDFRAGEVQFVDHLAAIYLALPPEHRGAFITQHAMAGRLHDWGIPRSAESDPSRPVVVASYGDQKRVRREGRKMIARVEHGAGQSYFGDMRFGGNASYAGGRDNHDASLFLCPNEESAARWQDAYPRARTEVVGCPKLDYLPARRDDGDVTVAISFHFDINIIPESRWAYPAYKPHIPELAKRFNVIAHAHPKGLGYLERQYMRMGIEVVPDFADVCRRADVYAVDNSSTLFEFAATGRPVVPLNDPGFRRDVRHGGRFWDWATVGIQCDDPRTLADTVERALLDPPEQRAERERIVDQVYQPRSGGAKLAADVLVDWATGRAEVAA